MDKKLIQLFWTRYKLPIVLLLVFTVLFSLLDVSKTMIQINAETQRIETIKKDKKHYRNYLNIDKGEQITDKDIQLIKNAKAYVYTTDEINNNRGTISSFYNARNSSLLIFAIAFILGALFFWIPRFTQFDFFLLQQNFTRKKVFWHKSIWALGLFTVANFIYQGLYHLGIILLLSTEQIGTPASTSDLMMPFITSLIIIAIIAFTSTFIGNLFGNVIGTFYLLFVLFWNGTVTIPLITTLFPSIGKWNQTHLQLNGQMIFYTGSAFIILFTLFFGSIFIQKNSFELLKKILIFPKYRLLIWISTSLLLPLTLFGIYALRFVTLHPMISLFAFLPNILFVIVITFASFAVFFFVFYILDGGLKRKH